MKIAFLLTVSALVFCLVESQAFAVTQGDQDEATLKEMEQTWVSAVTNGDRITLAKLLDDSFIETSSNGMRRSKSDLLLAPPPVSGSSQTLVDLDVRINGDTAIVNGINQFKPARDAQAVNYAFTDVFVRKVEGWRVLSSQMTRR
jgi:hypothetical protein